MPTFKVDRDGYGVDIVVYGLAELERALRALTPEVGKEMNSSIRAALSVSRDTARARIPGDPPMSGWREADAGSGKSRGGAGWPGFNAGRARSGITVRKGQARNSRGRSTLAVAWRLESRDPAATIFDKAETGHSSVGRQFVANLDARHGESQRVLWPAWLATRNQALAQIRSAIGKAERALQRRADAIDGRAA